ncbi:MAG: hypothetical protein E6Q76_02955 [Rhizobium sp.]|nr:MAG: hypothetical protein E6Q76_02955 [Rhizobium sp.]
MANFAMDFSSQYGLSATLFATSTGVTQSANAVGASVDLSSNAGSLVSAVLVTGNAAGTNPTLDAYIQESTDGSSNWTSVTGGAFAQVTASNNVQVIAFKPTKRYLRSNGTTGGINPVFETTCLIGPYALRTAPANDGGWDTTVAPAN